MKKLFVETYGCQMNVRDSEEVTGLLLGKGYARTEDEAGADVILYNTCSVREHAEHRVWSNVGKLRYLKKERPELVIGVMGCMAKAQRGKIFQRMPHVDFISGPSQLYEVPELIEAVYESRSAGNHGNEADGGCDSVAVSGPIAAIQQKTRAEFKTIGYHSSPVQAMVTIMEGCDKVCSYCIIPYTRGPEVSRPPEQIVEEVRRVVGEGYREVLLLGQNVNSYGKRLDPATSFSELLRQVNAVPGISRVRFITSHPWDAVEELFDAMRDLEHVCEHLHLPVQSGSDEVLKRMRRGYTGREYLEKLDLLRKKVPDVSVTTDLIVGFPGETEDDFEATVELVERARFDSAFIFSYSPRPFAAASRWEDDVPAQVKDRRLQALLQLQERISREEAQKRVGTTVDVLVEEPGMGRTRQNRKCYFAEETGKPGDLVNIHVKSVRGQSLIGRTVRPELVEGQTVRASTSSARAATMIFLALSLLACPAWADDEMGSLQAAYLRGEYERVYRSAKEMQERGQSPADGLLYLQGVSALKLGDSASARSALQRAVENDPNGRWAPPARLALADSWESAGEHEKALEVLSGYLKENKERSLAPQALLRMGLIQRQMGHWDDAKASLQTVVEKAGGTPEAGQAADLLRSGDFYFCVQVGAFVTRANAEKVQAELRRRGYAAEVSQAAMQGRFFHRVRVGRFATRREAEDQARRLQQDGFPGKVFP